MIKKLNSLANTDGGFPPFMSVIKVDYLFPQGNTDGVFCQELNGKNTLVFSLRGQTVTMCKLSEDANVEELLSFFEFYGIKNILSDFLIDGLQLGKRTVLKAQPRFSASKSIITLTAESVLKDYKNVFGLLSNNGDFAAWYPSFSRKINNAYACGVYAKEESVPVSCAVAPFISDGIGIVAGVYTEPSHRGKGYATGCIHALLSELKSKSVNTVYLWCEDKNINLYKNAGFTVCGEIYVKKED